MSDRLLAKELLYDLKQDEQARKAAAQAEASRQAAAEQAVPAAAAGVSRTPAAAVAARMPDNRQGQHLRCLADVSLHALSGDKAFSASWSWSRYETALVQIRLLLRFIDRGVAVCR